MITDRETFRVNMNEWRTFIGKGEAGRVLSSQRMDGTVATVGDIEGNPEYPIIIKPRSQKVADEFVRSSLASKVLGIQQEFPISVPRRERNRRNI